MSHSPQAVHAPADQSPRSATLAVTVFPLLIIGGAALGLMPLLAFGIAWILQLPPALAAGLILVG